MKSGELNAFELDEVVAATKLQSGADYDINIGDYPNVRVDVTPI